MNNIFDELTNEEEALRASIVRRARVEGIEAAYLSALDICRDKNAPAQAKSNASRTLLQIGGLLDRADRQSETTTKEPHEMTQEELQTYRRQLERESRALGAVTNQQRNNAGNAFE